MSALKETAFSEFKTGQLTVGETAVQLATSPTRLYRGVTIVADESNSGTVVVGNSNHVTTSTGFPLLAGESVTVNVDDAAKVWLIADDTDQLVKFMGN